jgi:cell division protease FtsH
MTREELEHKIMVLLGGRAAEKLVFGQLSTGAADDLAKASEIARGIVMRYGMDPALGAVAFEPDRTLAPALEGLAGLAPPARQHSEATAREIDLATRQWVDKAVERATQILTERRALLERGAQELLARETLSGADLARLLQVAQPALPAAG